MAATSAVPGAPPRRDPSVRPARDDTALLQVLHDLDIDAVFHDRVQVYVIDEEIEKLAVLGITPEVARIPSGVAISWWPYPGLTDYRVYRSSDPSQPGSFVDVTAEDADPTDTRFDDVAPGDALYGIVTGVGPRGEGPEGHFGE